MNGIKTCLSILNITDLQEADEDGGGGLDMDEFRQAMIKTMAGKGEVVRHKLYNSILTSCMTLYVLQSLGEVGPCGITRVVVVVVVKVLKDLPGSEISHLNSPSAGVLILSIIILPLCSMIKLREVLIVSLCCNIFFL